MVQLAASIPAAVPVTAPCEQAPTPGTLASFPGEHGRTDVVGFRPNENRNGWVRLETHTRYGAKKAVPQYSFCASSTDLSPVHQQGQDCDPRCGCCYLSIPHTQDLHELKMSL